MKGRKKRKKKYDTNAFNVERKREGDRKKMDQMFDIISTNDWKQIRTKYEGNEEN